MLEHYCRLFANAYETTKSWSWRKTSTRSTYGMKQQTFDASVLFADRLGAAESQSPESLRRHVVLVDAPVRTQQPDVAAERPRRDDLRLVRVVDGQLVDGRQDLEGPVAVVRPRRVRVVQRRAKFVGEEGERSVVGAEDGVLVVVYDVRLEEKQILLKRHTLGVVAIT